MNNPTNEYAHFLMTTLALDTGVIGGEEPYDEAYPMGIVLYQEFEGSDYDAESMSEYDAILKFLKAKKDVIEADNRKIQGLRYQIMLQEDLQAEGLNVVYCANCSCPLIHRKSTTVLDCWNCSETVAMEDCKDLYYDGMPVKESV